MLNENAHRLSSQTLRRQLGIRLKTGIKSLSTSPRTAAVMAAHFTGMLALFLCRESILDRLCADSAVPGFMRFWYGVAFFLYVLFITPAIMVLLSTPLNASSISDSLHRAGVVNAIDEPPMLLSRTKDPDNDRVTILDFITSGISRAELEKLQPQIESALDCFVVKITDGPGRNRVLLHTVAAESCLPDTLLWDTRRRVSRDPVLIFGQTVAGTEVSFDLDKIPHILLGGSTGSGKTVLLRLLLRQCVEKEYLVHIADFKGGLDYSGSWRYRCTLITESEALLTDLRSITAEMNRRKALLLESSMPNITEYNRQDNGNLTHIIFAVDELAELLDKTGASKERKAEIDEIISELSTLARLGRAFGIHLILATQRPDAGILPGQIKNNLDIRACGRADNVLSQIILDSTAAAERIPKDSHLFILGDGTLFQPYILKGE